MVEAKLAFDGVKELWSYNRENFMYDRRMRQEQELQISEWRCTQAELWREDVRDLVGLTERKMDSYLVVNTLQLGMCVALFTEGRLEPGTPHWLLHFYMLTLGAAFMYLLMSVWLAMHASVVAACENVRLLTQSVRLPIPTWEQLESMRTYASSYETVGRNQLRIPFIDQLMTKSGGKVDLKKASSSAGGADKAGSSSASTASDAHQNVGVAPECLPAESRLEGNAPATGSAHGGVDTWSLESHGCEIYELQRRPLIANRHVNLVKRAATHYQCHDAFARVAMSFGTNQLLFAITYYCLGYVSVGDGAPWPAACIAIIMSGIAAALVKLDFSFSEYEHWRAFSLVLAGPACSSLAACAWSTHNPRLELVTMLLLPIGYIAHGCWLLWALRACKVELHPGGEMLPTKFRTVLYLDVFGWLNHRQLEQKEERPAKLPTTKIRAFDQPGGNYMAMPQNEKDTYSPPATPFTQAPEKDTAKAKELNKPLTCTVLPPGSARSRAASPDVVSTHAQLVENIEKNLTLYRSESAQRVMDDFTKARVESLVQRFQAVVGEAPALKSDPSDDKTLNSGRAHSSSEHDLSCSEPDCEPWVNSKQREFDDNNPPPNPPASLRTGSVSELPSLRSPAWQGGAASSSAPHKWQEMHYYTDLGTEVPYLYDPQTGQVQHTFVDGFSSRTLSGDFHSAPDSVQSPMEFPDLRDLMYSLAYAEECIDTLEKSTQAHEAFDEFPVSVSPDPFHKTLFGSAAWLTDLEKRCKHSAAQSWPWLLGDVGEEEEEEEEVPLAVSSRERKSPRPGRRLSHLTPGDDCVHAEIIKRTDKAGRSTSKLVHSAVEPDEHVDKDDVVLAMEPDKIPWKVFRNATLLLVCLWGLGPAQLFGLIGGITEFGPMPHAMRAEFRSSRLPYDPDGGSHGGMMQTGLSAVAEDYPALPEGTLVKVGWPRQSGLRANVLSSDRSGRHVVVADDFGVYAGQIQETGGTGGVADSKGLRGSIATGFQISFKRAPQCTALEGQALKDIGIVCSKHDRCHVLVLHTNGQLLTQCPLLDSDKDGVERPVVTWKISGDWLDTEEEQVESLAVNDECGEEQADEERNEFYHPDAVGCVIVGTTSGRVVQLRRHVTKEHQLVPAWAMQQRHSKVGQGSLHAFSGGFVMILRDTSIQALDARQGNVIGQWELPQLQSMRWLTICGGGNNIYLLGRNHQDKSQLWRFPLPDKLREAISSRHRQESSKSSQTGEM